MPARSTQPCAALPVWGLGGTLLGLATGLLGRNAVLVCTEAVERTVHRHIQDQLAWLADSDPELSTAIQEIEVEELEHLTFATDGLPKRRWPDKALGVLVAGATETLIWLSTYGASARMARTLRQQRSVAPG